MASTHGRCTAIRSDARKRRPSRRAAGRGRDARTRRRPRRARMASTRRTTRAARTTTTTTTRDDAAIDDVQRTPERAPRTTDDVSALLASPFLLFASALSPITPRAHRALDDAVLALADDDDGDGRAPRMCDGDAHTPDGRRRTRGGRQGAHTAPAMGCFNSPSRRASSDASAMSDVERLALSVDASIRHRSSSTTVSGATTTGMDERMIRRQLDTEFGGLEMNTLEDDKFMLQNMYDEFDDSVIGVESRENTPSRGSARRDEASGKRSSATGASVEWTKGFTKTLKNFDVDSPRVGTRSIRRVSYQGSAATMETPVAKPSTSRRASGASKNSTTPPSTMSARTPMNAGAFGSACRPMTLGSKKCNCKKSKCLKLYCECFAAGAYCSGCSCLTCQNTADNAPLVDKTRHQIELRNPNAFASKILEDDGDDIARHTKGCHCKKSACLKKYCECFQAGVKCQDYCKCEGCKNNVDGPAAGPRGGSAAKKAAGAVASVASVASAKNSARSKKHIKEASAAAAKAARAMQDDLHIEDFKLDVLGSPIRSFEHADDLTSEYSTLNKSIEQSPLRTLLLSEGVTLSPLFTNNNGFMSGIASPLRVGQMSPLRSSMMSPFTPSMRSGKFSIRPRGGKVPVPLFNDDSSGEFKTPRDAKTNDVFGGKHDGSLRATFTSPIPLSTPDVFE